MTVFVKSENPPSIERLPQVMRRVGYSRSSLYAMIAAGKFPAPILLGGRAVGWLSHEVDEWISSRVRAPRGGAPMIAKSANVAEQIVNGGPGSTEVKK